MAVTVTEVGIGRAVIETVPKDGAMVIRFARVPSASCGGYILTRSKSRHGWGGGSTDDDSGFETVANTTQPSGTSPFSTIQDGSPPSGVDVFYRLRAVDNVTTPTEYGPWSNVASWHYTNDRQAAVPTWPMEMRPNLGPLKGIVRELQDADPADGPTWYELRLAMAAMADTISNEIAHRASERVLLRVMIDPPQSLQHWFGFGVAAEFVPLAELHPERMGPAAMEARRIAKDARTAFLDDPVIRLPGSEGQVSTRVGRLQRG